jgi:uncharacterized protein (TIGR04255 family)
VVFAVAAQRLLTNAPVKEALVDIRFEPALSLETIDQFVEVSKAQFPKKTDIWEALVGFHVGGEASAKSSAVGRRLDSPDVPYVMQCRVGGFTFSRLSPYVTWTEFRAEARNWWQSFQRVAEPRVVTRVAVRYLNAIPLPLPMADFGDYFTCPPQIPRGLPQALSGFLQRVVIPDRETLSTAIVTQALEDQPVPAREASSVTVLLDIDVFRETQIPGSGTDEIFASLDVLRDQKNRMFFEHLTEKTVEMFL